VYQQAYWAPEDDRLLVLYEVEGDEILLLEVCEVSCWQRLDPVLVAATVVIPDRPVITIKGQLAIERQIKGARKKIENEGLRTSVCVRMRWRRKTMRRG
jgi:hypothetical protein